jgi:hypothetical protein
MPDKTFDWIQQRQILRCDEDTAGGRTNSAATIFSKCEGAMDVTDVTDLKEEFGDLNIRRVPRFLLYELKSNALKEGVTLRRYVLKVLALSTSGDLGDLEIDYRD